jgi:hypothetical protein
MTANVGVPDVAVRTVGADTRRKVMLALTVAYVMRTVSQLERGSDGKYEAKAVYQALLRTNIPAWVVLYAVLAIASDFDATRELAVAFAILIMVSVLLYDGPRLLAIVETWTDPSKKVAKKKATAKPKRHKKTGDVYGIPVKD